MSEPSYTVERRGNSVTMWIRKPMLVMEKRVPCDGSIMIRDAHNGEIVGKRIDDISTWSEDAIGNTFAMAFGYGCAGPLIALGLVKPHGIAR